MLPAATQLGLITLAVRNLELVTGFYEDLIGLQVLDSAEGVVILGSQGGRVLRLVEHPDRPDAQPFAAGLYHSGLRFASAGSLARALDRTLRASPYLFQGSSDHLVSQAFYFTDPEGNGVELYLDRPKSEWKWQAGQIQMDTLPLDTDEFINENLKSFGEDQITVGHIHLRVGDVAEAKRFYIDTIGFEITGLLPSAVFGSAGGYHHHIAVNAWESAGAGMRDITLGLERWELVLPSETGLQELLQRLQAAQVTHEYSQSVIRASDPWGTTLIARVKDTE